MKHMRFTHLIVLLAAAMLLVFIAGCPKAPDSGETVTPDTMPPDVGGEPGADADAVDAPVAIPESAATLGEAMAAFQMPSSFEMTMLIGDEDTQSMVMKMDGADAVAFRAESDEGIMIVNVAEKAMYMYNPEDNSALKMPLGDDNADMPNPYDLYEDDLKITGSETIDGVDCWVIDSPGGEGTSGTAWIDKANGLMRQAIEGDTVISITYDRVDEVPDSEFELPEGATVQEFDPSAIGGAPAPE